MIIAVDFDGTIVEDAFPGIGQPKERIVNFVIRAKKLGHKIIIWTCRTGERLEDVRRFLNENSIPYDTINENLKDIIAKYDDDARKIVADLYIDDRARNVNEIDLLEHMI